MRCPLYDPATTTKEYGMTRESGERSPQSDQIGAERPVTTPRVDVVICAYTLERESLLRRAIASASSEPGDGQVIVVVDHNPELLAALTDGPDLGPDVSVCTNRFARGLSGARNTGVEQSEAEVVAFLDDDAEAAPGWRAAIRRAHADPRVVGTGGWVDAEWEVGDAPRWFPEEFLWTVGCSYPGLPESPNADIRNPIGASMSFARDHLAAVGGFRTGLGRIGTAPFGCEETEAAIKIRGRAPGGRIVLLRDARVRHFVPRSRATWSYFASRCVAEGRSKAMVTAAVGSGDGLASERRYVRVTLPAAVVRGVRDALRGDIHGLQRSGAVIAGLTLTVYGYLAGRRERSAVPVTDDAPADVHTDLRGTDALPATGTARTSVARVAAATAGVVAVLGAAHVWWHRIRGRR
jgi:GT2 family glycosyltransferase